MKSKQITLFVVAAAGLILAFVVGKYFYTNTLDEQKSTAVSATMTQLVRPHAQTLGPSDAPVVIVEFFDPACETCAAFYPFVKQMMAANNGKIRLVLRYAPFHRGSDMIVAALEAARRQGKFWPALEALLATQPRWAINHTADVELAWPVLEGAGVDVARARQEMLSPEIAQIIAQDVADVRALNISKTPEFFVNGKPLPSFGADQLKALVDDALRIAR